MGQIFGGILGMVLFSMLFSTFLFKSKPPIPRAVATVLAVWIFAVVVYTLGGNPVEEALLIYSIGAPVAFWERKLHYEKHWIDDEPRSEWYETFR